MDIICANAPTQKPNEQTGQPILSDDLREMRKASYKRVAFEEAVNPHLSRYRSMYLSGEHTPVTRESIVKILGESEAVKWDILKAAAAAYYETSND